MPISINGTGTITGISAGGLPDACVTAADLASGAARSNFGAGCILQVVQEVQTNVLNNLQSTSFADLSGLTATITPSSTSNKILVTVSMCGGSNSNSSVRVVRDGTPIALNTTGSPNNRRQGLADFYGSSSTNGVSVNFTYLDSPASVASLTYKMQYAVYGSSTFCLNSTYLDADAVYVTRGISTITLMEIAG